MTRQAVITGIGIVSCVGEGVEAHLAAFRSGAAPPVDATTFAPYPVHPAVALDYDKQIPKKSDQRQMEPWQRLGCYAAGLALDAARAKGDAELKSRMHLIVAAGGGERDYAVDSQILTNIRRADNPGVFLNERLMSDLRPTLFLAQLSNLLAGNISIVHGVTGATRTFMGEEQCGVDAIRVAQARIAAGQADIFLVGGSYNAERPDILLIYEMGGFLWKHPFVGVWERPARGGGFILGSAAAFVVMESAQHADGRGARPLAAVAPVEADRTRRQPGDVAASVKRMWSAAKPSSGAVLISGATGVKGITEEEQTALLELAPGVAAHATSDIIGHTMEAQVPAGVAIGAALIDAGAAGEAVVTSIGHKRGEGLIRLTKP
jgi:3-oxoacyl-[acyl-carrier-protein] synthase II